MPLQSLEMEAPFKVKKQRPVYANFITLESKISCPGRPHQKFRRLTPAVAILITFFLLFCCFGRVPDDDHESSKIIDGSASGKARFTLGVTFGYAVVGCAVALVVSFSLLRLAGRAGDGPFYACCVELSRGREQRRGRQQQQQRTTPTNSSRSNNEAVAEFPKPVVGGGYC